MHAARGRASPPPYSFASFAAAFFFVFGAAAALAAGAAGRLRLMRALSFFWLMRRRIFIERRLSRLPMGLANTGLAALCQLPG
jgi:hypothetical protein